MKNSESANKVPLNKRAKTTKHTPLLHPPAARSEQYFQHQHSSIYQKADTPCGIPRSSTYSNLHGHQVKNASIHQTPGATTMNISSSLSPIATHRKGSSSSGGNNINIAAMFSPPTPVVVNTTGSMATPNQPPRYSSSDSKRTFNYYEDGGKLSSKDLLIHGESDVTLEEHKSDNSGCKPGWEGLQTPHSQQYFPSCVHSPSSIPRSSASKQMLEEERPQEDISSLRLNGLQPYSKNELTLSGRWDGQPSPSLGNGGNSDHNNLAGLTPTSTFDKRSWKESSAKLESPFERKAVQSYRKGQLTPFGGRISLSGKKKMKEVTDLEKRILKNYNPNILDSSSQSEPEEQSRPSPEFKSPFSEKEQKGAAPIGRKTMEKQANPERKARDEKFGKKLEMPPNERYGQPRGADPSEDEKKGIISAGLTTGATRTSASPFFTFAPPASTFSSCKGSSVGAPAVNDSNVSSDRVEFRQTTGTYPFKGSPFVGKLKGGTGQSSLRSTKKDIVNALQTQGLPLDSLVHEVKNGNEQALFAGTKTLTSGVNTPTLYAEENGAQLRGTGSFLKFSELDQQMVQMMKDCKEGGELLPSNQLISQYESTLNPREYQNLQKYKQASKLSLIQAESHQSSSGRHTHNAPKTQYDDQSSKNQTTIL